MCPTYLAYDTCLARKSIFEKTRTYCNWDDNAVVGTSPCSFNSTPLPFKVTIYIQVMVSIMSAIILRPLSYLFDILLSPNVDTMKAKLAEEAALKSIENVGASRQSIVGKVTRRVGRVANSVASMITFAQPKQVDPKELENMPVTLIPDEVEMSHTQAKAYFRKLTQRAAGYVADDSRGSVSAPRKSLRFTMLKRLKSQYEDYRQTYGTEHADIARTKWEGK
jgi:hypothetical protein